LHAVIGEALPVFITPTKRFPMKTTTRPAAVLPMLPAPLQQQPRQLSIAFETPALQGLSADHRAAATQVLAVMLLQAVGVHLSEDDDVEH
jgi:hypothetical protein